MSTLSYAHGTSEVPLLGETIGANLERAARPTPTARRSCRATRTCAAPTRSSTPRSIGSRAGSWRSAWTARRPAGHVEPELRRVGAASSTPRPRSGVILVNINPAYRTSELEYVLRQSGCRVLVAAPAFKTSDYGRWSDEVRAPAARARADRLPRHRPSGTSCSPRASAAAADAAARPRGRAAVRRSDQHPVHERHHRLPEGRHALSTTTSSTTASSWRAVRATPRGPRLHPRALLPLLRHGDRATSAAPPTARAW